MSEDKPDNPYVYPEPVFEYGGMSGTSSMYGFHQGLTLRDHFAGLALQGLMANSAIVDGDAKGVPALVTGTVAAAKAGPKVDYWSSYPNGPVGWVNIKIQHRQFITTAWSVALDEPTEHIHLEGF